MHSSLTKSRSFQHSLVEKVLSHFEDGGVVLVDPPAGEHEAGGTVGEVVGERNVDVESRA